MRSLGQMKVGDTEKKIIRASLVRFIDCFLAEEPWLRTQLVRFVDYFLVFDFRPREWTKIARLLHSGGDVAGVLLHCDRVEWALIARILNTAGDTAEILSHKDGLERYQRKLKKRF